MSNTERNLNLSRKKLKELVAKALGKTYEEISIEYNEEPELIVEVKTGHFTEEISFKDERILKALGFDSLNLELVDVTINESRYSYRVDADDADDFYLFRCKNHENEKEER